MKHTPGNLQDQNGARSEVGADLPFGRFLRFWRGVHSVSQEELAHRLGRSPRHLSRLENGSSRPSEAIVHDIAKALALGERDSNHLLISAGFVPGEDHQDFNSPELRWLRKAMILNLRALDPYPSTLMNSSADIVMVNKAWVALFSKSIAKPLLDNITNHYDFMFSGFTGRSDTALSEEWNNTLAVILMSLQQNALFASNPAMRATVERLAAHPGVPDDWQLRASNIEPMASFRVQFNVAGKNQRFFNVSSMVGAMGPTAYVSEPRLTLSTLYPEDDQLSLSLQLEDSHEHPMLFY